MRQRQVGSVEEGRGREEERERGGPRTATYNDVSGGPSISRATSWEREQHGATLPPGAQQVDGCAHALAPGQTRPLPPVANTPTTIIIVQGQKSNSVADSVYS